MLEWMTSQVLEQTESNSITSPTELAKQVAPIKSNADLTSHLDNISLADTPLGLLSANKLTRFTTSLTFNEKGLTGFSYADIRHLTASQAHEILGLFSVQ